MLGQALATLVELAVVPILIGACFGVIFALLYSLNPGEGTYANKLKRNALQAILFSIPTVLVAYVAGYLTGISRAPAVGNLVPAVLVLIGGLNIYLFGTDRKNIALVGYSVFIFTLVLFFGFEVGIIDRELGRVARLVNLSDQEKLIRTYRENRELPPDPPAWMLGGEAR
jgi:hypothetical protein